MELMRVTEKMASSIEREYSLSSQEVVSSHIKAIGEAIIKDAEQMRLKPNNIASIKISAEITPCTKFTYIQYEIERIAGPMIPERGENNG